MGCERFLAGISGGESAALVPLPSAKENGTKWTVLEEGPGRRRFGGRSRGSAKPVDEFSGVVLGAFPQSSGLGNIVKRFRKASSSDP